VFVLACFGLVYLVIAGLILPKQEAWHGHGARTSTMTRPRRGLVFGGMSGTSLSHPSKLMLMRGPWCKRGNGAN
jgi:hypothetical protein